MQAARLAKKWVEEEENKAAAGKAAAGRGAALAEGAVAGKRAAAGEVAPGFRVQAGELAKKWVEEEENKAAAAMAGAGMAGAGATRREAAGSQSALDGRTQVGVGAAAAGAGAARATETAGTAGAEAGWAERSRQAAGTKTAGVSPAVAPGMGAGWAERRTPARGAPAGRKSAGAFPAAGGARRMSPKGDTPPPIPGAPILDVSNSDAPILNGPILGAPILDASACEELLRCCVPLKTKRAGPARGEPETKEPAVTAETKTEEDEQGGEPKKKQPALTGEPKTKEAGSALGEAERELPSARTGEAGRLALWLWERLGRTGRPPSDLSRARAIRALGAAGEIDAAFRLFEEARPPRPECVWQAMLSVCGEDAKLGARMLATLTGGGMGALGPR